MEKRANNPSLLSNLYFYLALLHAGFAKPMQSPAPLVVSYTTISHLPP